MKGILICTASLFKRHFRQNLLLILQIMATLTVLTGFLGKLQYITHSSGIADTFHDREAYYYSPYSFTASSDHPQKILSEHGIDHIRCSNYTQILVRTDTDYVLSIGYDDTLIDYVNVKLSDGIWFSEYTGTEIPLIGLDTLYHTGQHIELKDTANTAHDAVIIGTVSPSSYILTFDQSSNPEDASLDSFVSVFRADFIAPYCSSSLPHLDNSFDAGSEIIGNTPQSGQILLPESETDYETLRDVFRDYGLVADIRNMLVNYRKEIRFDLLINGILLGIFALMTVAGIGGINGIQSRLNRRNYIIYYMLGMQRKSCAITELLRTLAVVFSAFVLFFVLYLLTPFRALLQSPDLFINAGTFIVACLFMIIVSCTVSLKYVLDLGKGSLITHYKNQE